MRSRYSKFAILPIILVVAGCSYGNPKPMGRGYYAYDEEFKSPPGKNAQKIGYDFDVAKNNTVIEDMRSAASDLVKKLDQKLSFSDDKLYLVPNNSSAFYTSFDYVLRDELVKSGYTISTSPNEAVSVAFAAEEKEENEPSIKKEDYRPLHLALIIHPGDETKQRLIDGIYEVPTYGFTPGNFQITQEKAKPTCEKKEHKPVELKKADQE